MKLIKLFFTALSLSLLFSCATIPQESVDLSVQVGVGLKKQYQSQVDLVNLNFSIKRKKLDALMLKTINNYFKRLTPAGSITLSRSQLGDVANDVIGFNVMNNKEKEELEKARLILIKALNENYEALSFANASVTGILQSAVDVKAAHTDAFKKLSDATHGEIDLDKVFTEVDEFATKQGEKAGKAIKLVDKIKTLIDKKQAK